MKILKEYKFNNMKVVEYDGNDFNLLISKFCNTGRVTHDVMKKLCDWLLRNNEVVIADDCYDAQSGWHGTNFRIGKADLSCNGYCLRDSQIELFLNGGTNKMWY